MRGTHGWGGYGPRRGLGTASSDGGGGEDGAESGDRIFWKGSHLGHEDCRGSTASAKEDVGGERKRDGAGDVQGGGTNSEWAEDGAEDSGGGVAGAFAGDGGGEG